MSAAGAARPQPPPLLVEHRSNCRRRGRRLQPPFQPPMPWHPSCLMYCWGFAFTPPAPPRAAAAARRPLPACCCCLAVCPLHRTLLAVQARAHRLPPQRNAPALRWRSKTSHDLGGGSRGAWQARGAQRWVAVGRRGLHAALRPRARSPCECRCPASRPTLCATGTFWNVSRFQVSLTSQPSSSRVARERHHCVIRSASTPERVPARLVSAMGHTQRLMGHRWTCGTAAGRPQRPPQRPRGAHVARSAAAANAAAPPPAIPSPPPDYDFRAAVMPGTRQVVGAAYPQLQDLVDEGARTAACSGAVLWGQCAPARCALRLAACAPQPLPVARAHRPPRRRAHRASAAGGLRRAARGRVRARRGRCLPGPPPRACARAARATRASSAAPALSHSNGPASRRAPQLPRARACVCGRHRARERKVSGRRGARGSGSPPGLRRR